MDENRDVPGPVSGVAAPAAPEPTPSGTDFVEKAKDIEALRSAVIDATSVGARLWLSYLFVLFYLAIAVGSVTHRNLLFESPVKLPFLNVDLLTAVFNVPEGTYGRCGTSMSVASAGRLIVPRP
jgi:hypothetical protein